MAREHKDETERLNELHRYAILDTQAEQDFDDFTWLAAYICNTPISLISLVDENRQWFKSHYGTQLTETPREYSFCAHALFQQENILEVPDAAQDARFASNPLVKQEPSICYYAGAPLVTSAGYTLGTLCVIDTVPRTISSEQRNALQTLARQVVRRMELHLSQASQHKAETRLKNFMENSPAAAWITDLNGDFLFISSSCRMLFDTLSETENTNGFLDLLPKEQALRIIKHIQLAAGTKGPIYLTETIQHLGRTEQEFILCLFPMQDPDGSIVIGGTALDITQEKRNTGLMRLLSRVVEQTSESVMITDVQSEDSVPNIVFTNPAFTRITGYTLDEVAGKSPDMLLGPRSEAMAMLRLHRAIQSGDAFSTEMYNYRKNGTELSMEWVASPVRDDNNSITHYVITQRDTTEHRQTRERVRMQFERLAALRAIDASITGGHRLVFTLGLVLDQLLELLKVSAADVMLYNKNRDILETVVQRGFGPEYKLPLPLRQDGGPAWQALKLKRIISLAELPDAGNAFLQKIYRMGEIAEDYMAVPLITRNETHGVLQIYHTRTLQPDDEWMEFLETLAGQAAIAIYNSTLLQGLEEANIELIASHDATIEGWSRALDLRDKETEGHSQRVTEMTVQLAREMGLDEGEQLRMRRGALLHDVGKLGIPDSILLKPGPLSEEEWKVMRQHPILAYEMLWPIKFLRPAIDIPWCHHEKWDGSGYPHGLVRQEIPLAARIFAVADVHDALCSNRSYRQGWPIEQVREYMKEQSGIHFDPEVIQVYLKLNGNSYGKE